MWVIDEEKAQQDSIWGGLVATRLVSLPVPIQNKKSILNVISYFAREAQKKNSGEPAILNLFRVSKLYWKGDKLD